MSKIIVRRQEYANNGTHANEIESVVKQNLIVNTLSSAMDVAPSVGLLKNVGDALTIKYKTARIEGITITSDGYVDISSYKPTGMNNFLFALIRNFGSTTKHTAFNVMSTGDYLYGTAQETITWVEIAYFYTD